MREEKVLGSDTAQRETHLPDSYAGITLSPALLNINKQGGEAKGNEFLAIYILRYEFSVDYPAKLQRGIE